MDTLLQDSMPRAVLGLLVANILATVATRLASRTLHLRAFVEWLVARVLPWLLRVAIVEVVLISLPAQWADVRALASGAVCLYLCSALLRHLLEALREHSLAD